VNFGWLAFALSRRISTLSAKREECQDEYPDYSKRCKMTIPPTP